jgi:hypothetical protein
MPRLVSGIGEDFAYEATVTAGTAIAEGDVLDISGNVLQRATASSTIHTLAAVAAETISTTATTIRVIPIIGNETQIWEFDTTNNSATTQRYENAILTDHATLNNTDTTVTGPTGIFTIMFPVGAASAKKVLGHFNRLQVTST